MHTIIATLVNIDKNGFLWYCWLFFKQFNFLGGILTCCQAILLWRGWDQKWRFAMASCPYCSYGEPGHDKACPESMSGQAKVLAQKSCQAGYRQGRSGKPEPTDASASYSLGYGRGIVALEEAENGYDPRFDDMSADPAYYDSDDY
ncbi:MAG: hypothetical protein G01um101413_608 [Parcubacteria group bacterium Gr01-1014_13]|nr:MAG: hypothetical protein G01um101413_608 [Parcubacteria group bacterium Gr01-1014_13]